MKITKYDYPEEQERDFVEIVSNGMIEMSHVWVPIEVSVEPTSETEKAYYGKIIIYEVNDVGRSDEIYSKTDWIPKSMSDNPWWICTNLFDHSGKIANRRFDGI